MQLFSPGRPSGPPLPRLPGELTTPGNMPFDPATPSLGIELSDNTRARTPRTEHEDIGCGTRHSSGENSLGVHQEGAVPGAPGAGQTSGV